MIIALYVDDLLLGDENTNKNNWMRLELSKTIEMQDPGKARQFLVRPISRAHRKRKLWCSRGKYITTIINHFQIPGESSDGDAYGRYYSLGRLSG